MNNAKEMLPYIQLIMAFVSAGLAVGLVSSSKAFVGRGFEMVALNHKVCLISGRQFNMG